MSVTSYKKNQGRPARQIALCIVAACVSWLAISICAMFVRRQIGVQWLGVCIGVIVVSVWLSMVLLNRPRWADFLISVQAEVDKVTWPSTGEVKQATAVVLILITSMAVVIFCFDLIWQWVFQVIGFLQIYRR